MALLDAIEYAVNVEYSTRFIIISDSLSALKSLENPFNDNPLIQTIQDTVKNTPNKEFVFLWVIKIFQGMIKPMN